MRTRQRIPPEGWFEEFFDTADLRRSYELLEGLDHFYAETLRGRVRSLQLRTADAWAHFEEAVRLAGSAPATIANLVRQVLLHLYLFDNALLAAPVSAQTRIPYERIPSIPDHVVAEYPEVAYVLELRQCAEGYLRLHLGEHARARRIFRSLARSFELPPDATLSFYYCGLAAAEYNLGLRRAADRSIENAELALQSGGRTLNRVRMAATLCALHSFLHRSDAADEWRRYLDGIDCPDDTKRVFVERAELIVERCAESDSLVVL